MDLNFFDDAMNAIGITPIYYGFEKERKTMPAKSKAQYRAMGAAAGGKSNLDIPKKVGKEFVKATKKPGKLPEKKEKPKK